MVQVVILVAFFASLVVGAVIANALGVLPNAEQLAQEDAERLARFERSLE